MSSRLVVCTWYTDDHWLWVRSTTGVLDAYRHAHDFTQVAAGDETTKPERILQAFDRNRGKIVVAIDVDAVVRAPLNMLSYVRADVALVMFTKSDRRGEPRVGARSGKVPAVVGRIGQRDEPQANQSEPAMLRHRARERHHL